MEKIISEFILAQNNRCITYKDYMEWALYHPTLGYYNRHSRKIGKQGDFYTSSNVGEVFGRALGKLFNHLFKSYDIQPNIIELGGGTGKIAHSVLHYLQETNSELFSRIFYTIIETSPYHQSAQQKVLSYFNNVTYVDSLEGIGNIEGIVFSNEFFDAFPVHVIERKEGNLVEVMVSVEKGVLVEKTKPLQNEEIASYLQHHGIIVQEGQRLEIPLSMMTYYHHLCEKIQKGFLLTIDYGYTKKEWTEEIHRMGSLRGYSQHRLVHNILENPGKVDITSHIHWDSLKQGSLQTLSFLPQNEFLVACGLLEDLTDTMNPNPFSPEHKRNRAIRSLLQSGQISSYMQALVQVKNLECMKIELFPGK